MEILYMSLIVYCHIQKHVKKCPTSIRRMVISITEMGEWGKVTNEVGRSSVTSEIFLVLMKILKRTWQKDNIV